MNDASELDDNELIKRIVAGEKELYRYLVSRYKNLVFSLLMRQISNPSIAEEIAQETFINAFTKINTFRGESAFSTWLARIALNQSNNYFKSRRFKNMKATESFDLKKHQTLDKSPEDIQEEKEKLEQFRDCLSKLNSRFREIIVLCGLEEKAYQDVASELDIPVGTVRSRLNKARLLLKDCMATQA